MTYLKTHKEVFPRIPEHPVTRVNWLLKIKNYLREITSYLNTCMKMQALGLYVKNTSSMRLRSTRI